LNKLCPFILTVSWAEWNYSKKLSVDLACFKKYLMIINVMVGFLLGIFSNYRISLLGYSQADVPRETSRELVGFWLLLSKLDC
jgi:hypothetical protein